MSADITTATSHCISVPGPSATYKYKYRLFFIDKTSATNAVSWYHGRKGEPKTNNSHIRTCHRFLSYIQIALKCLEAPVSARLAKIYLATIVGCLVSLGYLLISIPIYHHFPNI